jgi:UDP-N-acetylmuramoyl-tripeptide--D-alanyl-D-alanine ligase
MNLRVSDVANYLSSSFEGTDRVISKIVIDSRNIKQGDLFLAIPGVNNDGHEFIKDAIDNGAACIVCEKPHDYASSYTPTIIVKNSIQALGNIAKEHKMNIGQPYTIGITGTNGKTTVTKLCTTILSRAFRTSSTIGNYNNEIGLPLSILNASQETERCIYEHGARKQNDINYLTKISQPDLTALLNVSEAHMESFKSMENLILTKEEIFSHSRTKHIILNIDDTNYLRWQKLNQRKKITTLSLIGNADYVMKSCEEAYSVSTTQGEFIINKDNTKNILPINILFSIAITMESGSSIDDVINGLKSFSGIEGRFYTFYAKDKSMIIDDSYNANPESMKSALRQLASYSKNRIFVMGDMGELGINSQKHHQSIFKFSKQLGIEYLFYMGEYRKDAELIFGENCFTSDNMDEIVKNLKKNSGADSTILIKASRFMNFDYIVKELK